MIPELIVFSVFCLILLAVMILFLAEDERLEDLSERRAVNRMADRSRRGKSGARRRNRYSVSYFR